jgi:selenocysteine lyase/cysteine desulfurase
MQTDGVITISRVGFDASGQIDPDDIRRQIQTDTRLIVLTHASNVLGTIQPIDQIGTLAREHDLLFLVDAAQTAGNVPINVDDSLIDLLAAPGHKSLLGPPGTGFLYTGPRAASIIRPNREGGTGGDSSSRLQPAEFPFRLEGGTPNTVGVAGLGAAIDFITETGIETIRQHETSLVNSLMDRLATLPNVITYPSGTSAERVAVTSFNLQGLTAAETGAILDDSFDIAVRAGLHCAPYLHQQLGTMPDGTVRVSFGPFSTIDDVNKLIEAVEQIS